MDRKNFLKLGALASAGVVSTGGNVGFSKGITQSICIYDNYIRGLMYYKNNLEKVDFNQSLNEEIIREKHNKHDQFAIAVYIQGFKIGYIAAFENIVLAKMMDAGVHIEPEVFIKETSKIKSFDYLSDSIFIRLHAELVASNNHVFHLDFAQQRADDAEDEYRIGWRKID